MTDALRAALQELAQAYEHVAQIPPATEPQRAERVQLDVVVRDLRALLAEYPPLNTHTEYGMKTSPAAWVAPTGTRNRAQAATEGLPEAIIVSREVTDWAPVKNLSPSPGHLKNRAETLHMEEA
ncbi:MAG: hypothetical protein L0G87_01350 [Renibacterium salmoninarum]|nr:hypothetical protein [Renibacterium salmoninarum]